jgi:hypothetical protein
MRLIIAVLLLAVLLASFGFALHLLWWIALVVIVVWLIGFVLRSAEGSRRWYRW